MYLMTEAEKAVAAATALIDDTGPRMCRDDVAREMLHDASQPLTSISNYISGARRLLNSGSIQGVEHALAGLEEALKEVWRLRDTLALYRERLDLEALSDLGAPR